MKILNLTDQKVVIDVSEKCGYPLEVTIKPGETTTIFAGTTTEHIIKEIVNKSNEVMFLD